MIYLISDIHGYPFEKVMSLLQQAGFNKNDFLFVLGDVIDRGYDGVKMLQWMMRQSNVKLILGNHEAMLLSCDFIFDEINDSFLSRMNSKKLSLLNTWKFNGAETTIREFTLLPTATRRHILEYLREAPLYDSISLSGRDYLFTHSGLGNFDKNKKMCDYTSGELLWNRPGIDTKYSDDITVIFGHTPTVKYGKQFEGKMLRTDTWIDIDTGAGCGLTPMLLCLDNMKEFYPDESEK